MGKLFEELKRRKVFRVAAVYAVVAWVLIQISDVVLPTFGAPEWVNQTIIFLFLLGFLPTLIAAWAYEITPQGVRADTGSSLQQVVAPANDRKLIYAIFALVLLVAVFQISDRFVADIDGGAGALARNDEYTGSLQAIRSAIILGVFQPRLSVSMYNDVAVSADGTQLAYTGQSEGVMRLYSRNLLTSDSSILAENGGNYIHAPVFSPSGKNILYSTATTSQLRFTSNDGSQNRLVTDAAYFLSSGNWLSDQTIVFTSAGDLQLHEIPLSGGQSTPLAIPHAENEQQTWPQLIPGQQWLLYSVTTDDNYLEGRIDAFNLVTGEAKTVVERAYKASFAGSGHVVFLRDGDLWAAPIDSSTAELRGREVVIERNIENNSSFGKASYSFSDMGRLIYQEGPDGADRVSAPLTLSNGDGEARLHTLPENAFHADFSPDGKDLAVTIRPPGQDSYIAVYNLVSGTLARRSFVGASQHPIWTADGMQLVYNTRVGGDWALWLVNADGSGQAQQLISRSEAIAATSFSAEGRRLVFTQGPIGRMRIMLFSPEDRETPIRDFISGSSDQWFGRISPDGRWLAYTSVEPEGYGVYVRPFPNIEDGLWQVSSPGGISREPMWGANGKQLYYIDDGILNRVEVTTDSGFSVSRPAALFELSWRPGDTPNYALSPDGDEILYRSPEDSITRARPRSFVLVENWFEKLNQMAPPNLN